MVFSRDEFLQRLTESGVVSSEIVAQAAANPPTSGTQDGEALSRELVQQQRLTKYQAEQILLGKGQYLSLGNYVILDKLGQGGMGMVLKAEHRRMKRLVALKVMSSAAVNTPDALKRFHREVEAAAKLRHPNIVAADDADEAKGTHFLVMEYVDGSDLSALVKRHGPLPVERAIHWIIQAARGLEYAHEQGVIHRDIKPANLLVDAKGTVKILDMGLARIDGSVGGSSEGAGLTCTGTIMGTVDYMSPEQAMDTKHADARSDIYSLGCSLYYLLTGRALYDGDTMMKKLMAHQNAAIPSLVVDLITDPAGIGRSRPGVADGINAVFRRMVAKLPENRQQSMTEVITDLERCLSGSSPTLTISPVSARGSDAMPQFSKKLSDTSSTTAASATPGLQTTEMAESELSETMISSAGEVGTVSHTEQSLAVERLQRGSHAIGTQNRRIMILGSIVGAVVIASAILIALLNKSDKPSDRPNPQSTLAAITSPSGEAPTAGVGISGLDSPLISGLAPPPAIAPFDAKQARAHQVAWATHLGTPVEYTNSIGMKFVLVPPGEFTMGNTEEEIETNLTKAGADGIWKECIESEAPQHKVILTHPIYIGVNEVTQRDYQKVFGTNPSHFSSAGPGKAAVAGLDTTSHPVEMVSWNDAAEFCAKLSEMDELKPWYVRVGETVTPLDGNGYRLPTEAEWEFACRAGTTTRYWTGDTEDELKRAGWFNENSRTRTHGVGELIANPLGLSDIHGNVWEWVEDSWHPTYYKQFADKPAINPSSSFSVGSQRVIRGGDWSYIASTCRSSGRLARILTYRNHYLGFRVVLPVAAVRKARNKQANADRQGWLADAPKPAIAPFDAAHAKKHQEEWAAHLKVPVETTNSVGMKMIVIPPGEFNMGHGQVEVTLTRPFRIGKYEVTQGEFRAVMKSNPSYFSAAGDGQNAVVGLNTNAFPVEMATWDEATAFCRLLTAAERRDGKLPDGWEYRLPTDAQWEYACRAGTFSVYIFGNAPTELGDYTWYLANSDRRTQGVGQKRSNAWGLHDMNGNVWEWCRDWHAERHMGGLDPEVTLDSALRVFCGGSYENEAGECRSAVRYRGSPDQRNPAIGFRVTLVNRRDNVTTTHSR